ncbi:hypothetical protein ACHAXR_013216 [Thalassiosira sp. AJA248-18]
MASICHGGRWSGEVSGGSVQFSQKYKSQNTTLPLFSDNDGLAISARWALKKLGAVGFFLVENTNNNQRIKTEQRTKPPPIIMGASDNNDFDPYEGMDPDNINFVHSVNYSEMRDLIHSLPPGWKRLDPKEMTPGQPPYLHEPSGETSWKNPNLEKFMGVVDDAHEKKRKENDAADASSKAVKKLRLMLQAGAPLGAVEQKAKLEGIDISLVLSPSDEGKVDEKTLVSDSEGEDGSAGAGEAAIPETLLKKYKRMIKAGVPMDRVQQLAGLEAGASPEQVAAIVLGGNDKKDEPSINPLMTKFLRMQKAGIPVAAIQNSARLQGHDIKEVNEALGVSDESKAVQEQSPAKVPAAKEKEVKNEATIPSAKPASAEPFTPQKGTVAFPSSRGGQNMFPLTDLIRKMAQTVQKTSQFAVGFSEMVLDELTLYHALGALNGVQFARDEYNTTIGAKHMDKELLHSKRHGFVEMATSIGMTLPNDSTRVDIEGLDDLIQHIETVNHDELDRGRSLLKDGYYDFDSIHTLYQPGSYVVVKNAGGGGVDCFSQVVWHRYTQGKTISGKPMKYFQLCCRLIVPVGGGNSAFAEVVDGVELFEGRRSLSGSALGFVPPLEHERKDLLQRYNVRGDLYNKLACTDKEKAQHSYMAYEKGCFFQKMGGGSFNAGKSSFALATSGRIVIDFDAASDNGHTISVGRDDMIDSIRMKLKEYKLLLRLKAGPHGGEHKAGSSAVSAGTMILFSQVPVEYLALVWPTTVGFSLTSKSWGDVVIDGLKDIAFDQDVFDRLVLSDSRKRMIKALVKHTSSKSGFHDLVEGKGEGTVFLLYGLPGSGKTLTAEAIAESLHRPLYSMSMGTLGTTAGELERRLAEILQLSARWDALVLLDEADSFLEARSSSAPLERNAMVSVMLRLVEYHQGILFLTSNRIDSLDPAFQTRITLALRYEPLALEGRAQVWRNLLLKSGKSLVSLDVNALAETALNGREIKNALRLAMALAADEGGVLSQELLLETTAVVDGHKDTMKTDWNDDEEAKPRGWLSSWWS